jgi:hypothetical protein
MSVVGGLNGILGALLYNDNIRGIPTEELISLLHKIEDDAM